MYSRFSHLTNNYTYHPVDRKFWITYLIKVMCDKHISKLFKTEMKPLQYNPLVNVRSELGILPGLED